MSVVYTIGYEGSDIGRFTGVLKAAGVQLLADVRAVAVSRKAGFSKSALREALGNAGIDYEHFVKLGDPKPGRDAARAGNHAAFLKIYNQHLKRVASREQLSALLDCAWERPTCLMCYEKNARYCHRAVVASRLEAQGLEVFHLVGYDPDRYARHSKKMPRHRARQSLAAAE